MAYSAEMQKIQYHAKKNGLVVRKIAGNYFILDTATKKFITDGLTLDQLKKWFLGLMTANLKSDLAV